MQHVVVVLASPSRAPPRRSRPASRPTADGKTSTPDLRRERRELLDRRRPVDVGRDDQHLLLLPAQQVRELRRRSSSCPRPAGRPSGSTAGGCDGEIERRRRRRPSAPRARGGRRRRAPAPASASRRPPRRAPCPCTRAMKSLTTGSATSASSSARRTSRSASWMLASVRRASPRSCLTTRDSRWERLSNIGSGDRGGAGRRAGARRCAWTERRRTCGKLDAPHTGVRRTPSPMILLHVVVAALYALTAWRALAARPRRPVRRAALPAPSPRRVGILAAARRAASSMPGLVVQDIATAQGLDFSLLNAMSVVGALRRRGRVGVGAAAHAAGDRSDHPAGRCRRGAAAGAAAALFAATSRIRTASPTAPSRSPRCTSPSRSSPTRCSSSPRCRRWC